MRSLAGGGGPPPPQLRRRGEAFQGLLSLSVCSRNIQPNRRASRRSRSPRCVFTPWRAGAPGTEPTVLMTLPRGPAAEWTFLPSKHRRGRVCVQILEPQKGHSTPREKDGPRSPVACWKVYPAWHRSLEMDGNAFPPVKSMGRT